MPELFTVNEAAAIAEISAETVRTALEKKAVTPSHRQKNGKTVRHHFSEGDVFLVKVLAEFPFSLSKSDKEALAKVLAKGASSAPPWYRHGADLVYRSGDMEIWVECKSLRKTLAGNLEAYRWGRRRIASSPDVLGGETVFRGTRIPVQHVASLFRKGIPESEIAEDFPGLSSRDLAYARLVARFGKRPGRPRKRLTLRRRRWDG